MTFSGSRMDVARFALNLAAALRPDSRSITIMLPGKSEVFCVTVVTGIELEDIVKTMAQNFSLQLTNT